MPGKVEGSHENYVSGVQPWDFLQDMENDTSAEWAT